MSLYLRDVSLVDFKTLEVRRGNLQVFEGLAGGFAFVSRIPSDTFVLDCKGKWVTKSFAIAHHHLYALPIRGLPPLKEGPRGLNRLDSSRKAVAARLDLDMIRAFALAGAVEAAKSGVTFVIDHHASPEAVSGCLQVIAEALEAVGLSHLLCLEISQQNGLKSYRQSLQESEEYLKSRQGLLGLDSSSTVSQELLKEVAELARELKAGIHAHAGETEADQWHCLKAHKRRILERFAEAGILGPKTLLAHCLHLDSRERRVFAESLSWAVHCPEAAQLGGANFNSRGLDDRVLLGTDGLHCDALASLKAARLASPGGLSALQAYRRLRRVHDYLDFAGFKGDGDNNLVVLDYDAPTEVHGGNWPEHLCAMSQANVDSVISSGRLIVEHGRVTNLDENRVMALAREQAKRLWPALS